MHLDPRLIDFTQKLHASGTMDDALEVFHNEAAQYGATNVFYGFVPVSAGKGFQEEALLYDTHASDFMDAYVEEKHLNFDWSIDWSLSRTEAVRWATPELLASLTPRQLKCEQMAWDFGIREGVVMPIRGLNHMSKGGIGFAAKHMQAKEWHGLLDSHQSYLELLAQAFHEYVIGEGYFNQFKLSEREQEVLKLIVCGSNKHNIADRLNISSRTSEVHMYSIRKKLKCVNDAQVTAKALICNLV